MLLELNPIDRGEEQPSDADLLRRAEAATQAAKEEGLTLLPSDVASGYQGVGPNRRGWRTVAHDGPSSTYWTKEEAALSYARGLAEKLAAAKAAAAAYIKPADDSKYSQPFKAHALEGFKYIHAAKQATAFARASPLAPDGFVRGSGGPSPYQTCLLKRVQRPYNDAAMEAALAELDYGNQRFTPTPLAKKQRGDDGAFAPSGSRLGKARPHRRLFSI